MPDIFGREALDYRHLADAHEIGVMDAYLERAALDSGRRHDFAALGVDRYSQVNDIEQNAQALGYLTNNLQSVQARIEEILYTEARYPEFIAMAAGVPQGANTYSYRVVDRAGRGRFISHDGTDAPSAQVGVRNVPYQIEYGGIVPSWSRRDLALAQFAGIPLDMETMDAATNGALDHIEQVIVIGDEIRGFSGFANHSEVSTTDRDRQAQHADGGRVGDVAANPRDEPDRRHGRGAGGARSRPDSRSTRPSGKRTCSTTPACLTFR